jgi:hypothetical protein
VGSSRRPSASRLPAPSRSCVPSVRGDTFAHPQIASLTADPEGAPVTGQFDVVYFDAAGAEIEPLDGARLDLTLVGDLSAK